jgi:Na+-driven multidrug efflux pump
MGSATTTIVSQNIGANQVDRAEEGYKKARLMAVVFLFVAGMILSRGFISTAMADIFSDDPQVIPMAADFVSVMAFWCFTNGVYNTTTGLFNGAANTVVTMIVDAARLWVFRFATLFLFANVFNMHERSVWYCVVASNGISAAILWILYKAGLWRAKIKKLQL